MVKLQPFFILSNPRSGSSLLRVICDSHSSLTVAPESGFIVWWYNKYRKLGSIRNKKSDFEKYCEDLISSRKFETWNFDLNLFRELVVEEDPRNYSEYSALVHRSYGIQRKKNIASWGDKNNYYIHHTSLLNELFPTAKFIFIIRDGRDVATSYKGIEELNSKSPYVPKLPTDIREIALEWNENNLKVLSFLESIDKNRSIVVRYEDLIYDTEGQCIKICEFLNVPFDPLMLKYHEINKAQRLEPLATLDWKKKTLKSPDKLSIGKYKSELTTQEIEMFNFLALKALKKFKYEVE